MRLQAPRPWLPAMALIAAIATPVIAAPPDGVDLALSRGDYGTALSILLPRAQRGEAEAEFRLALLYGTGQGVPQNYLSQASWCHDAAERGYAPAQLILARLYFVGVGLPRDRMAAYVWANLAASRFAPGPQLDDARRFRDFAKDQLQFWQIYQAQQIAAAWRPKIGPLEPVPIAAPAAP